MSIKENTNDKLLSKVVCKDLEKGKNKSDI